MKFSEIHQIKNFEYAVACTEMKISESNDVLVSIGTYRPAVKTHDLFNLTQKTERHLEAEAIKVEPLDKNAEKLCVLRQDRVLEFHAKYGMHERIKLPYLCYDVKYNKFNANILCCGQTSEVYRFDLEHGKFLPSYLTSIESINAISINKIHGLIGLCGEDKIQFIDQRTSSVVSSTHFKESFTSFDFSDNGLNFTCGSLNGNVYSFDLLAKQYLSMHSHKGGIKKVRMIGKTILSADKNSLKFFKEGEIVSEMVFEEEINTFETCGGVVFIGFDAPQMRTYYSLEFGDIPDWCKTVKTES